MNVNVAVFADFDKLKAESIKRKKHGIKVATSEFRRYSSPYVRFLTGELYKSAFRASELENGLVIWDEPYAFYAWSNEKNKVTKDHHPDATPKWTEVAKAKHWDAIMKTVDSEMKKL